MSLILRPVSKCDCKLLFEWANEKDVRANSISNRTIDWLDHQVWFNNKLNSSDSIILILEENDILIGQIRFDRVRENQWVIDYSVDKEFRGRGYGKILVKQALQFFPNSNAKFIAYTRQDNIASQKVFKEMSFKEGFEYINGQKYKKFTL